VEEGYCCVSSSGETTSLLDPSLGWGEVGRCRPDLRQRGAAMWVPVACA
jgi:hypothetical protein